MPAAPVYHRTMEDVLPPGLLEICLLVGVPRERVRALLQVRGGFGEVRFCQRGAGSPSRVSSSLAGPLSLTGI